MKLDHLMNTLDREPVFATGLLLSAGASRADVERQLSRWTGAGKLLQLRRGLYALAPPYRKTEAHPYLVANRLREPSYVSLQSALEFHGMIPESVPTVTSVTTSRPEQVETPLGSYLFRHVKRDWFCGFALEDLGDGQSAFIASPEKALLDLIGLTPQADRMEWLSELRLQNLEAIDEERLAKMAKDSESPKLVRAAKRILQMKRGELEAG